MLECKQETMLLVQRLRKVLYISVTKAVGVLYSPLSPALSEPRISDTELIIASQAWTGIHKAQALVVNVFFFFPLFILLYKNVQNAFCYQVPNFHKVVYKCRVRVVFLAQCSAFGEREHKLGGDSKSWRQWGVLMFQSLAKVHVHILLRSWSTLSCSDFNWQGCSLNRFNSHSTVCLLVPNLLDHWKGSTWWIVHFKMNYVHAYYLWLCESFTVKQHSHTGCCELVTVTVLLLPLCLGRPSHGNQWAWFSWCMSRQNC